MGPVVIRSLPGGKAEDPSRVESALQLAGKKLGGKWGEFEQPVEIYVMPQHRDLEYVTRRWGYGWLRAWAQYEDVMVQAPSTWAQNEHDVGELLAHELTHCLMYQRSATRDDWAKKPIPLWFREGMATWTADQGYRWMTLEDLAREYEKGPGHDPISDADALYKDDSAAVYGAAHYAFTFLVKRYGTEPVEAVLRHMSKGETFEAAFQHGVGISHAQFIAEFRRYIVWRAFRGSGHKVRVPGPSTR